MEYAKFKVKKCKSQPNYIGKRGYLVAISKGKKPVYYLAFDINTFYQYKYHAYFYEDELVRQTKD